MPPAASFIKPGGSVLLPAPTFSTHGNQTSGNIDEAIIQPASPNSPIPHHRFGRGLLKDAKKDLITVAQTDFSSISEETQQENMKERAARGSESVITVEAPGMPTIFKIATANNGVARPSSSGFSDPFADNGSPIATIANERGSFSEQVNDITKSHLLSNSTIFPPSVGGDTWSVASAWKKPFNRALPPPPTVRNNFMASPVLVQHHVTGTGDKGEEDYREEIDRNIPVTPNAPHRMGLGIFTKHQPKPRESFSPPPPNYARASMDSIISSSISSNALNRVSSLPRHDQGRTSLTLPGYIEAPETTFDASPTTGRFKPSNALLFEKPKAPVSNKTMFADPFSPRTAAFPRTMPPPPSVSSTLSNFAKLPVFAPLKTAENESDP